MVSIDSSEDFEKIETFLLKITESELYISKKYLVFTIRKQFLKYLSSLRTKNFIPPLFLLDLIEYVGNEFDESGISPTTMLNYMLKNDCGDWIHYFDSGFLRPISTSSKEEVIKCDKSLFILVLTGFIFDFFSEKEINIEKIIADEKLSHNLNQYGLSIVNGVDFKRDFLFMNKRRIYIWFIENELEKNILCEV